MTAIDLHIERARRPGANPAEHMVRAAARGMFRIGNRIDGIKDRSRDPVALADARTSMTDYRCLLAVASGRTPDRNGYVWVGDQ